MRANKWRGGRARQAESDRDRCAVYAGQTRAIEREADRGAEWPERAIGARGQPKARAAHLAVNLRLSMKSPTTIIEISIRPKEMVKEFKNDRMNE